MNQKFRINERWVDAKEYRRLKGLEATTAVNHNMSEPQGEIITEPIEETGQVNVVVEAKPLKIKPTKKEIISELKLMGVKFKKDLGYKELSALLKKAKLAIPATDEATNEELPNESTPLEV